MAISGGPDSSALLGLLHELSAGHAWRLVAAHFDHGLRPGGRDRAEALRERVAPLGVEWRSGRSRERIPPTHEALRSARYAWLRAVAHETGARRIATGHQRDDQVETILFRILRGTGSRGLAGIPVRRGRLVRPLLGFTRAELAAWLDTRGVPYVADPSNEDRRWARNRVRHDLLPALAAEMDVDVDEFILSIGRAAAGVQAAARPVVQRVLRSFETGDLAEWPAELRAEALRAAARRRGVRLRGRPARRAAEAMLRLRSGQGLDLGAGLRIERSFDTWSVRSPSAGSPADVPLLIPGPAAGTGRIQLGGRERVVRWGHKPSSTMAGTRVALYVPGEHYPLTVRGRLPGDRIRLPGGTRRLSRVFGADRVDARDRDSVPVVADCRGNVLCAVLKAPRIARDARPGVTEANDANNANIVIEVEDG